MTTHNLKAMVYPPHTALLSMEMQRGVVGDLSRIFDLVSAVQRGNTVATLYDLMRAARANGVPIIHCNAEFRADRKGSSIKSPMLAALTRDKNHMLANTGAVEVVSELRPQPEDFISSRLHGFSPFTATSLDITLRNMGIQTILACGVSVNLGIVGLTLEAANLGYQVVVVDDCVAGFPDDYVMAIKKNMLSLLASLATSKDIIGAWNETTGSMTQ